MIMGLGSPRRCSKRQECLRDRSADAQMSCLRWVESSAMWVVPTKEGRTVREIVAIWYRGATYQLGRGRNFYGIWPAGVPGAQPFERWPLTPEGWYGAWSRFAAIEAPGTIVPAAQHGTVTAGHPGVVPAGQRTAPAAGTDARSVPGTAPNPRIAPATGLDDRPAPGAAEDARSTPGAGLDDRPAPGAGTDARIGTGAGTDQWTAGTDSRTGAAATDKLAAGMGPQTAAAAGLYGGTAAGAALDQAAAPGAGFQPAAPAALTDDLRPAAGGGPGAGTAPAARLDEPAAPGAGLDERTPPDGEPAAEGGPDWRPAPFGGLEWPPAPPAGTDLPAPGARRDPRAVIAAVVVAVGVVTGIASLFPGYLGVSSLAQQPDLLVPHVLYLAGWSASALLILLGGVRLRIGALLGTGLSIVTFGFFLSDLGTVIADGSSLMGAGLVLGLIGWLACTAGSVMAFPLRAGGWLGSGGPARQAARPRDRVCPGADARSARRGGGVRPGLGQLHPADRGRRDADADRGLCVLQPGRGDRRGRRRDGRARRRRRSGRPVAAGAAGSGAARRCCHPDGRPGDLRPHPGRPGHLTDAVRDLAGTGRAGRAEDHFRAHPGLLDLRCVRRRAGRDVRAQVRPAPPGAGRRAHPGPARRDGCHPARDEHVQLTAVTWVGAGRGGADGTGLENRIAESLIRPCRSVITSTA